MKLSLKKFIIVAGIMVCLFLNPHATHAQAKIGYISLNELIVAMPEYKKADTVMAEFQRALQEQNIDNQKEFARKDSIFAADSLKWSVTMRDLKRKELRDIYVKMLNFQQS